MKRKPKLKKKTLRNLKLKLKKLSDRKAAPMLMIDAPSNTHSCV
jgi:hypothetical protein